MAHDLVFSASRYGRGLDLQDKESSLTSAGRKIRWRLVWVEEALTAPPWKQNACVWVLARPLVSCVMLKKLLVPSDSWWFSAFFRASTTNLWYFKNQKEKKRIFLKKTKSTIQGQAKQGVDQQQPK